MPTGSTAAGCCSRASIWSDPFTTHNPLMTFTSNRLITPSQLALHSRSPVIGAAWEELHATDSPAAPAAGHPAP
jgi:hypothetical protein